MTPALGTEVTPYFSYLGLREFGVYAALALSLWKSDSDGPPERESAGSTTARNAAAGPRTFRSIKTWCATRKSGAKTKEVDVKETNDKQSETATPTKCAEWCGRDECTNYNGDLVCRGFQNAAPQESGMVRVASDGGVKPAVAAPCSDKLHPTPRTDAKLLTALKYRTLESFTAVDAELARQLERELAVWKIKARTWQQIADQRAIEVADLRTAQSATRDNVIEEVAKAIEAAQLTYSGPDPHVVQDLRYLIVAAIRDLKGRA